MGGISLSQEIIEHILQFVDGETLLTCREVSPEFEAAVKYLSRKKNIWEKCYSKEKGDRYPYCIISKFHPHNEGFQFPKNWAHIYESCLLRSFISYKNTPVLRELKVGKKYSSIQDVETHEDLVLVLVRYNKDFSIYHRIVTINLQGRIVHKSCIFFANMLYVTPVEDQSSVRSDAVSLSCDSCDLVAVPICADFKIEGFPKFRENYGYLTIELSNGEKLWINRFEKLITKARCFHMGAAAGHEEIKLKSSKSIKVSHQFAVLVISCGKTKRQFNTFTEFRANVSAYMTYAELLLLGTDTGMLYAYNVQNEADLQQLQLKCYFWHFDVSTQSILKINVMELNNQFVIVCCSEETVYHIYFNRKLYNFI